MSKRFQIAALFFIVVIGFVLHLRGLSCVGFNEDEVSKLEAARAYPGNSALENNAITLLDTNVQNFCGPHRAQSREISVRSPSQDSEVRS